MSLAAEVLVWTVVVSHIALVAVFCAVAYALWRDLW